MIAPRAVLAVFSADLIAAAYGPENVDNFSVARATVEGWLRTAGILPVWSLEKASGDIYATQPVGPLKPFPTQITSYFFAPGSFGFVDGGTLDLGVVRDSTLTVANKFWWFMESFEAVAAIGPESLQLTSTICLSGGSIGTNVPADLCDDGGS